MKKLFGLVVDATTKRPYFSKVEGYMRCCCGDYELKFCLRETDLVGVLNLDKNDYIVPQQLLEWSAESS